MVLLAIAYLQGEAYGIPIGEEIERRTDRNVARADVYVTLRESRKVAERMCQGLDPASLRAR